MAKLIHTVGASQSQGQELLPEPDVLPLSQPGFLLKYLPFSWWWSVCLLFLLFFIFSNSPSPDLKDMVTKVTRAYLCVLFSYDELLLNNWLSVSLSKGHWDILQAYADCIMFLVKGSFICWEIEGKKTVFGFYIHNYLKASWLGNGMGNIWLSWGTWGLLKRNISPRN